MLNYIKSYKLYENDFQMSLWFLLPKFDNQILTSDNKPGKLTMSNIILKGSIIAAIITIPSIVSFFISWVILDDLMLAAIIGVIVHFIAMGFSLKLSKKLLVKKTDDYDNIAS